LPLAADAPRLQRLGFRWLAIHDRSSSGSSDWHRSDRPADPEAIEAMVMDCPTAIVEVDDWLLIVWLVPRPESIEITAEALEGLVELVNKARHPEGGS
jgi:hypothetical protein